MTLKQCAECEFIEVWEDYNLKIGCRHEDVTHKMHVEFVCENIDCPSICYQEKVEK